MNRALRFAPSAPVRLAPAWADRRDAVDPGDAAFLAGAGLAALDPIVRDGAPWSGVWRRRLALAAALGPRGGDQGALRDAFYLRRPGDDPGPAGRQLVAWRALSDRPTRLWPEGFLAAAEALGLRRELADALIVAAKQSAAAAASPVVAAAAVASAALQRRPELPALAFWLADAALAERLKWPFPLPLLAAQTRAPRAGQGDYAGPAWVARICLAYVAAVADACRLAADLSRRAEILETVAPLLRAKGAGAVVAALLEEDALTGASRTGGMDARSMRRLFDRLVALGALRELSGRATFRLYGL